MKALEVPQSTISMKRRRPSVISSQWFSLYRKTGTSHSLERHQINHNKSFTMAQKMSVTEHKDELAMETKNVALIEVSSKSTREEWIQETKTVKAEKSKSLRNSFHNTKKEARKRKIYDVFSSITFPFIASESRNMMKLAKWKQWQRIWRCFCFVYEISYRRNGVVGGDKKFHKHQHRVWRSVLTHPLNFMISYFYDERGKAGSTFPAFPPMNFTEHDATIRKSAYVPISWICNSQKHKIQGRKKKI